MDRRSIYTVYASQALRAMAFDYLVNSACSDGTPADSSYCSTIRATMQAEQDIVDLQLRAYNVRDLGGIRGALAAAAAYREDLRWAARALRELHRLPIWLGLQLALLSSLAMLYLILPIDIISEASYLFWMPVSMTRSHQGTCNTARSLWNIARPTAPSTYIHAVASFPWLSAKAKSLRPLSPARRSPAHPTPHPPRRRFWGRSAWSTTSSSFPSSSPGMWIRVHGIARRARARAQQQALREIPTVRPLLTAADARRDHLFTGGQSGGAGWCGASKG
jgi:hypothetical protein